MARPKKKKVLDHALDLTTRQVEILDYLWGVLEDGPNEHCEETSTTRIYESLAVLDGDNVRAPGTVLTHLARMKAQGILDQGSTKVELRDRNGNRTGKFRKRKSFIPTITREETRRAALAQFQLRFYGGDLTRMQNDLEEIL